MTSSLKLTAKSLLYGSGVCFNSESFSNKSTHQKFLKQAATLIILPGRTALFECIRGIVKVCNSPIQLLLAT